MCLDVLSPSPHLDKICETYCKGFSPRNYSCQRHDVSNAWHVQIHVMINKNVTMTLSHGKRGPRMWVLLKILLKHLTIPGMRKRK